MAADGAGDAGRFPVRLRHLQHRLGAEKDKARRRSGWTRGALRALLVVIMIGLDFFIASFAIGVGGTGWTLQGEVFPTAVRGQAAAIAAAVDWLANFALILVFPVWQNTISLAGVLVCFAALCAAAVAFVFWFLPETKGLPVEEIVRVFERQRGTLQPVTAVQERART